MNKKTEIHLLFYCNIYKEYSTMRLCIASLNTETIIKQIMKEIKNKNMVYESEHYTIKEQLEKLKQDRELYGLAELNTWLLYGYIETVLDGEEQ